MRNSSRTLQNSIFEPLYSDQEELQFLHPTIPITPVTFSIATPSTKATMKTAAATIFDDNSSASSDMAREIARTHGITPTNSDHGMCLPSNASDSTIVPASSPFCPPIRSLSASDVVNPDDGSVASKLLSSITKSISSPSLVACCKESARETPYQKSLRLKTMKLEYCAEELGSESCDGSLHGGDYFNSIFDSPSNMSSSQSSEDFTASHQKSQSNYASSKLFSVLRSSPNLDCSSLAPKPTSQSMKERSFPPPLSHTLPRSTSLDSFSYSLRAFREDGRFVLREFEVPCRQYFQASRKDGRLTLKRLTTDEDLESTPDMDEPHINKGREAGRVGACAGVCGDVASDKARDGSSDKIEVESAKNRANLVGRLDVCGVKGSKKGVDNSNERINVKEFGCLLPESISNGKNDSVNVMSHGGTKASSGMKSDFKAAKLKSASGKASRMRLLSTDRHLLSSLSSQLLLLHFPGKNRSNFKFSSGLDAIKGTQCAEILGLERKSARETPLGGGKASRLSEVASARWQRSDHGIGNSPPSTIIFKDVSAKCSMENVLQPVASFGLEYGGKWGSRGKEMNLNGLDENVVKLCIGGMMESSMHKWVKTINIGVNETSSGCSHESIREAPLNVKQCDRGCHGEAVYREGEREIDDVARLSCLPSSSFHCGVQISRPSNVVDRSAPALQGKEWLHSLHCKEIFHRKLARGAFIKLHCVA